MLAAARRGRAGPSSGRGRWAERAGVVGSSWLAAVRLWYGVCSHGPGRVLAENAAWGRGTEGCHGCSLFAAARDGGGGGRDRVACLLCRSGVGEFGVVVRFVDCGAVGDLGGVFLGW